MNKLILIGAVTALLGAAACGPMTPQQRTVAGGLGGATAGIVTARVLDANPNWTIAAGLAGAAVGTMVAQNQQTNECAYARGDGTYRIAPC